MMSYAKNLYKTWNESSLGLTMRLGQVFNRVGRPEHLMIVEQFVADVLLLCPDTNELFEALSRTILQEIKEPKE